MAATPEPNAAAQLVDQLTRDRLDLLAEKEKIEQRIADIDAVLVEQLPKVGGWYELEGCPGQGFRLQGPQRRFDESKARAILTPTEYLSICVSKPSASQARQVLGNAVVDQMYTVTGKPTVQALRSGGGR